MRGLLAALVWLCAATSTPAFGQQDAEVRFIPRTMTDERADQILQLVTDNLSMARGSDGQPLPPLTAAERAQPLLDRELVIEVYDIGLDSGIGQLCGLDWNTLNFAPLMQRERARGDRSDHQLAAIAMIHGIAQQGVVRAGRCGGNGVTGAQDFYARKWAAPAGIAP